MDRPARSRVRIAASALVLLAGCGDNTKPAHDASVATTSMITATVNSTMFVTREHMLAAGEMQISGEPLYEEVAGRRKVWRLMASAARRR